MVDTKNPFPIDVEDTACLVIKFSRAACSAPSTPDITLVGSASGYSGARYDAFMALRGTEGYVRIPLSERGGYSLNSIADGWASGGVRDYSFTLPGSPGLRRCRRRGVRSTVPQRPHVTAETALAPIEGMVHVLDVIEAAVESSETGRTVAVG